MPTAVPFWRRMPSRSVPAATRSSAASSVRATAATSAGAVNPTAPPALVTSTHIVEQLLAQFRAARVGGFDDGVDELGVGATLALRAQRQCSQSGVAGGSVPRRSCASRDGMRSQSPACGAARGRDGHGRQSAPHTITAVFQPASNAAAPVPPWPVASATTSATPAAPPRYRLVLLAPLPMPARSRGHRLQGEPSERSVDDPAPDPEDHEAWGAVASKTSRRRGRRARTLRRRKPRSRCTSTAAALRRPSSRRVASATAMLVVDHAASTPALPITLTPRRELEEERGEAHQADHGQAGE